MIIDSLRKRGAEQLTDRGPKGFRFGTNPVCWSKYSCGTSIVFQQTAEAVTAYDHTTTRAVFAIRIREKKLVPMIGVH
jgi:hypothetical protein